MTNIILDGKKMTNKEETHRYLKKQFDFPEYYGENLDALWDLLMEICSPTEIELKHSKTVLSKMGTYGENLIQTFRDAQDENSEITFSEK